MSGELNLRLLDVLVSMADELVAELEGDACAISRVIGDVLILVAERVHDDATLQLGQGYLVSDFPETAAVIATRVPRTLTLDDPEVDDREAAILRALGFGSLLMLPLDISGDPWGLVEVYRQSTRPFTSHDVSRALVLSRVA